MPNFDQGDVVRVPFPYTDRSTRQRRPALVVSRGGLGEDGRLLWVAMITSAENRSWADDVPFGETYAEAGLPAPSLIRPCKLATIESGHAEKIGRVNEGLLERVVAYLQRSIRRGLK
jgi:mRNA interferase MazF